MNNHTPFPKTRSKFFKIIVAVTCIALVLSACKREAGTKGTPIVAVTGGSASPVAQTVPSQTANNLPTISTDLTTSSKPSSLAGTVYYVAPNGNDSNAGTTASPFKTLAKGVSVLKPGQTLYLRSGTYVQTAALRITVSGDTTTGPITIATAPGEPTKAVISGDTNGDKVAEVPAPGSYKGLVELRGSYLILKDVEVAYSGERGILSVGAHNTIAGNNVHHIWRSGIYVTAPYNTVDGNIVYRAADSNYCGGSVGRQCNGNWDAGIAWGAARTSTTPGTSPNAVIRNNTVYHNSGEGILCMHTDNALVEKNVVYDNFAVNIDLDQCSYVTIQRNLVYATADTSWWRTSTRRASGIMISNEGIKDSAGNMYPVGHDRKVINNIVVGTTTNITFWQGGGYMTDSALVNDLFAYNTLVLGTNGFKIDAGPHKNTQFINNVVYGPSNSVVSTTSISGLSFTYNMWSKAAPSIIPTTTNIVTNPLLVDPNHTYTAGTLQATWYNLTSGSPAKNKSKTLTDVTNDFWGTTRLQPSDLGATQITR